MDDAYIRNVIQEAFLYLGYIGAFLLPFYKWKISRRKSKDYFEDIDVVCYDAINGFFLPQLVVILLSIIFPVYFVPDPKALFVCAITYILGMFKDKAKQSSGPLSNKNY